VYVSNPAANIDIPPLHETVFGILEPQSVADPNAAPPPSLPPHDLAREWVKLIQTANPGRK
jgi:hypothetical protein